ncbi:hypothetical protein [Leifsonia shinshuensis]|uniref:hypothetical protein n=1 Tax=Leifsonia TaxID=110932 RepID=UPI00285EDABF|nr:hypothetical protein [Leifsonia shinshuensis]MDR6971105.1 hypothetical protein [Leifsonia shinshuensis]
MSSESPTPGERAGEDDAAEAAETIDLTTFERTLSLTDLAHQVSVHEIITFPWFRPIDSISPTHTVGKGRTNLTLIASDIMQTDTTGTPYASFTYRPTPSGGPGVSVHFTPSAYGVTSVGSYVLTFAITANGPVSLTVGGYAGAGSVSGAGARTVNGNVAVVVGLHNVAPGQVTYASIQQTGGSTWQWYRTDIEYPPLIITL